MRKPHAPRRGSVILLVAISLTVLVGCMAITMDGGYIMERRRHVQAAADAAALAGAIDLYEKYLSNNGIDQGNSAADSARTIAAANGYPNDGVISNVTVHTPPTSGLFQGQHSHCEVIIEFLQPRYFSSIWGSEAISVPARAVARGRYAAIRDGIICLDPTVKGSLNVHGGGAITINSTVIVNSNNSEAVIVNGGGANMGAQQYYITGDHPGYTMTGGGTLSGPIQTGQIPTPDPLRFLPAPDPNSLPVQNVPPPVMVGGTKTYYLQPGRYVGGLSFSQGNLIMAPGIYYMDAGGFSLGGQAGCTGIGVMIYNAPNASSQKIDITGQGAVTLSPPTDGTYRGILIFQDRASTTPVNIVGQGADDIRGTFYVANAAVSISGNGDQSIGSQFICRTLDTGGNGGFTVTYNALLAPRTRVLQLVE